MTPLIDVHVNNWTLFTSGVVNGYTCLEWPFLDTSDHVDAFLQAIIDKPREPDTLIEQTVADNEKKFAAFHPFVLLLFSLLLIHTSSLVGIVSSSSNMGSLVISMFVTYLSCYLCTLNDAAQ